MSANISIFVPHNGCPNMCSFCNQFAITSHLKQPTQADVDRAVALAITSSNYNPINTEIAFFGGSFTAINSDYMIELLDAANKYVLNKTVGGIRVSTRPDCIDQNTLDVLKKYGVTTIELGAQSMIDSVLSANHRGHNAVDVVEASKLIKTNNFNLGLQMMTGLYTDDDNGAFYTCNRFIDLNPDFVRIYPTVVLRGTMLEQLLNQNKYQPQKLDAATELCAELLQKFRSANIPVIRLGLHTIDENEYVAGPWHPAFGELCECRIMLEKLRNLITKSGDYIVRVHPSMHSKTTGQKRANIQRLNNIGIRIKVVSDNKLHKDDILIEEVR